MSFPATTGWLSELRSYDKHWLEAAINYKFLLDTIIFFILHILCKKGDNPQNISFIGDANRWLSITCDKCFER